MVVRCKSWIDHPDDILMMILISIAEAMQAISGQLKGLERHGMTGLLTLQIFAGEPGKPAFLQRKLKFKKVKLVFTDPKLTER